MVTLGCVINPWVLPASEFVRVARAVEAAGLDEAWLWEDCFQEGGVSAAGATLASTERVRVGLGVLPVPLRNVALTAMEIATLEGMYPGRLLPGVGHGVQDWMGQVGARPASPLTLLREYTTALRRLLHGEKVTVQGRYVTLDDVVLGRPPASPPPLFSAGQGPKTLRLVGEVADGVVLVGSTGVPGVRRALRLLADGREAAGREDPVLTTVFVPLYTGPDATERAGRWLASEEIRPDRIGDFVATGSAEQVAELVRRFAEAGATSVVLDPGPGEPDTADTAAFLGAEVRPLLG